MPPGTRNRNIALGIGIILVIFVFSVFLILPFFPATPPGPEESLVIASGTLEPSVLTLIAMDQGYFKKHGLNVTLRPYSAGAYAVNELFSGNADLAYAAEFVGVTNSFVHPDLRILATTARIDNIYLIIRNDRGIAKPSDLQGKTIAVTKGTAADFFLGRYLALNGVNRTTLTILDRPPAEVMKSVIAGNADAAIIWNPYAAQIEQQLGSNSMTWNAQSGQQYYWVTYSRSNITRDRPETIRKYLRAINDADMFLSDHPIEAKEIIRRRMNITDTSAERLLKEYRFDLSLDQALLVEMMDEARWMEAQNMTGGRTPPSYLAMIEQNPMREIKPSAVTIIQ